MSTLRIGVHARIRATSRGDADGMSEGFAQGVFDTALNRRPATCAGWALDSPTRVARTAIAECELQAA